ncbi:MAG: extracellular solute-binding protein [Candidatus Heimdallarchaeota archaeon]|nr:extracellular solute-binding protein [Candidatus Heimdallarchaeota archaeon]MCK4954222.1 extracellular solute-binding protein [Candidatus Heimdallarchaeota archaeon]
MVSKYIKITLISIMILGIIVPVFFFSFYQGPKREIEINLWYTYEGIDVIRIRIEEYEELHPNIQINLQEQPASGWLDKFISVAQTGDSPDVFLAKGSWFGELANLEYIQPITPFITPQNEAQFLDSAIDGLSYENELWGLPLWFDSILLFYNKDLFDQNLLSYPLANWTDVELVNLAVNLTDRSENQTYGLVWGALSPYMWPAFQYGFNHGPLYQNSTIVINDTASVNTMEFIYDLKYSYRCVGYDDSSSSAIQAFTSNKGAMLIYGGWYVPDLNNLDVNYGVQILPIISSSQKRISPMVEIKGWGMSRDTEDPDICYDIISFLSSKETQEDLIQSEYKVPTLVELKDFDIVKNDPNMQIQIKQIENSQYYPLDPLYNFYSDFMRAALQFILLDHQDIETVLDEAQAGIDANKGR